MLPDQCLLHMQIAICWSGPDPCGCLLISGSWPPQYSFSLSPDATRVLLAKISTDCQPSLYLARIPAPTLLPKISCGGWGSERAPQVFPGPQALLSSDQTSLHVDITLCNITTIVGEINICSPSCKHNSQAHQCVCVLVGQLQHYEILQCDWNSNRCCPDSLNLCSCVVRTPMLRYCWTLSACQHPTFVSQWTACVFIARWRPAWHRRVVAS